MSPAEILAHEGDHAQSFGTDPVANMERFETPDYKYRNLGEKRAIANETATARALGHLKDSTLGLESRFWNNPPNVTFHTVDNVGTIVKSNNHTQRPRRR